MTRTEQASTPAVLPNIGPVEWRFAHPNAAFLVSVRVGSLLNSPFVLGLPDELVRAGVPGVTQQQVNRIWDIFNGIESVAISIAQRPGKKQADGLILLSGRFEDSPIVPMLRQQGAGIRSISLSPTTLLLGEGPDLEAAVRRLGSDVPSSDLIRSANRLAPEHDVWLGGNLATLLSSAADAPREMRQVLADIASLSLGMNFQENANLEMTIGTTGPAAVQRLLARMQSLKTSQKAEIEQAGNEIRLRVTGEPSGLSADLAKLAGSLRSQLPAQTAPAAQEPKPSRNTIIIHGLKDGPREIVVK